MTFRCKLEEDLSYDCVSPHKFLKSSGPALDAQWPVAVYQILSVKINERKSSFYLSISNRLSTRNYGNERESLEKRKQTRRTSPLTNNAVQDSSPWRALIREVSWPVLFADSGRLLYGRKPTGSSPISLSSFFFSNYFFIFSLVVLLPIVTRVSNVFGGGYIF